MTLSYVPGALPFTVDCTEVEEETCVRPETSRLIVDPPGTATEIDVGVLLKAPVVELNVRLCVASGPLL